MKTITRYGYKEEFGEESFEKLKQFIFEKSVNIEYDKAKDKINIYGRNLVFVFTDGKNIGEEMIKLGLAKEYTYKKPYKYQNIFKSAEKNAKNKKIGIWKIENIENNFSKKINNNKKYLGNEDKTGNGKIKGNINSKGKKFIIYQVVNLII